MGIKRGRSADGTENRRSGAGEKGNLTANKGLNI
jgi:hypothetical protein